MGPIFSLALALAAGATIAVIIFAGAALFLPLRLAIRMGFSATIGGVIGFAGTLFAQVPFYPSPISTKADVISLLGLPILGGIAGAVLCARMVWQMSRRIPQQDPGSNAGD